MGGYEDGGDVEIIWVFFIRSRFMRGMMEYIWIY